MPALQGPRGYFEACLFWLITCYISLLYPYHALHCEPLPCHSPVWPLNSALDARDRVQTDMTFVLESRD